MKRAILVLAAALALAGCMMGPNHVDPRPAAPAQDPFLSGRSPAFTGDEPPGRPGRRPTRERGGAGRIKYEAIVPDAKVVERYYKT